MKSSWVLTILLFPYAETDLTSNDFVLKKKTKWYKTISTEISSILMMTWPYFTKKKNQSTNFYNFDGLSNKKNRVSPTHIETLHNPWSNLWSYFLCIWVCLSHLYRHNHIVVVKPIMHFLYDTSSLTWVQACSSARFQKQEELDKSWYKNITIQVLNLFLIKFYNTTYLYRFIFWCLSIFVPRNTYKWWNRKLILVHKIKYC